MPKDISTLSPSTGMVKDTSNLSIKETNYLFALNTVLESEQGDYPFVTNELGNIPKGVLPEGATILGHTLTDSNSVILFVKTPITSLILEYNPDNGSISTIVDSEDLNFNVKYPVKALFRMRKGCERTIYFTDNYNPYRILNIDNLDDYGDPIDITRLNLYRNLVLPKIIVESIQDFGGSLKLGTYSFAIQYLDEDFNETSWVAFTPTVPITDDSLASNYYDIDGGIPVIDYTDQEGAVPNTTKSIDLNLTNLDQSFNYFRIAVLAATSTTGEVSTVYLLPAVPITSPTHKYTVRSLTSDGITLADVAYIQNNVFKIDRVGSHTQIDNRLILANLSYTQYEWGKVQIAAQKIKTSWVRKEVLKRDINDGAAKSPKYYLNNKSFLRDEVYAFGVYGILTDGTTTPVFHIPGRQATSLDLAPVTVVADDVPSISTSQIRLSDVRHLGITTIEPAPVTVPKWKVHNTAQFFGGSHPYALAYWESDVDYPNETLCDGVTRVFPTGKIRHHKMPDSRTYPIDNHYAIVPMGVKFDLDEFIASVPQDLADNVHEWKVCMAERTEANKTIIDKGYLYNSVKSLVNVNVDGQDVVKANDRMFDFITRAIPSNSDEEYDYKTHFYFSPKQLFLRANYTADYFSVEREFVTEYNTALLLVFRRYTDWTLNTEAIPVYNRVISRYAHIDRYKELDGLEITGVNPATAGNVPTFPAVRQQAGNTPVINNSYSTPALAFTTAQDYKLAVPETGDIYGAYVAIKKNNPSVYSVLHNLDYVDLTYDEANQAYFGGDIFIVELTFKYNGFGSFGTIVNAFYESEVNAELRHEGLVNPIIQGYYKGEVDYSIAPVNYSKGYFPGDEKFYVRPEYLKYNLDFSRIAKEKVLQSLPQGYDYCSSCQNTYPYRVVASEKSFQSEISDRYRTFKANNFIDLNGDCGGIEDILTYNDNIYALAKNYSVYIPTRPQTLQSNDSTLYVGTGEIFAVPFKKLTSPSYKYGGCQDFMSIANTEFGVFYADSINGKIFQLGAPPVQIAQGMNNWLEENLPFRLPQQLFELTNVIVPKGYPTNGLGLLSAFDTRHKRYILTKLDYEIYKPERFRGISNFNSTPGPIGYLYYDIDLNIFFTRQTPTVNRKVELYDKEYFINKSWTLSYSPLHKAYVSFHSYMPKYYFNDGNTFYSNNRGFKEIWQHNKGNYQTYYGGKSDHIIELVTNKNPGVVKTFTNMEFVTDATLNNTTINKTFDRAWFYTSNQSTGIRPLQLKTSTFQTFGDVIPLTRVQKTWRLNGLRDKATADLPLSTSSWDFIAFQYFIDKVPANISTTLTQFNIPRLRDRWLGMRLYFKPTENIKLTTNLLSVKQSLSYR